MADQTLPIDPFNPGQIFACLGLMEVAESLLGPTEGGFDWAPGAETATFTLSVSVDGDPVAEVLDFLANAEVLERVPIGWEASETIAKARPNKTAKDPNEEPLILRQDSPEFPCATPEKMALPALLRSAERPTVSLSHWTEDASTGLAPFKLYAGNRSGASIARAMIHGTWTRDKNPKIMTWGVTQLMDNYGDDLCKDPFNVLSPMRGSFNFDARGTWTALDAGYSLNDQGHAVVASPVVEILAALGLEYARPQKVPEAHLTYRYSLWRHPLPTILARVALGGGLSDLVQCHLFRFRLAMAGKNKVVTVASEDF